MVQRATIYRPILSGSGVLCIRELASSPTIGHNLHVYNIMHIAIDLTINSCGKFVFIKFIV